MYMDRVSAIKIYYIITIIIWWLAYVQGVWEAGLRQFRLNTNFFNIKEIFSPISGANYGLHSTH